ncbi:MAG: glutamate 5-kinase [bacterium]
MKRLVVKIGSSVLTLENGHPDIGRFKTLARDLSNVIDNGYSIVIVSSGAIAFGRAIAGKELPPVSIANKQVLSSIGQPLLINAYMNHFKPYNKIVTQVLLTHEDFLDRERYLKARRAMELMLEKGFIPVVNENDAIAVDEIKVGDNDTLSAMVSAMINADRLIILSDIDGIFDKDPHKYPDAKPIKEIENVEQYTVSDTTKSRYGIGGIKTKLSAAQQLARIGITTTIANGRKDNIVTKLVNQSLTGDNECIGTTILASRKPISGTKKWVSLLLKSSGALTIDDGAMSAILKNKSLLAAGIIKVSGTFKEGDVVSIMDTKGREIGRGITNYSVTEIELIKGQKSSQIKHFLGYYKGDEVVHRDNLILTMQKEKYKE